MGKMIAGKCIYCGSPLHIEEGGSVECSSCDRTVTYDELLRAQNSGGSQGGSTGVMAVAEFAKFIETPSSGLAYLENHFEAYDWREFEVNVVFDMDEISTIVEKNKVTHADKPETWLLEFKSIIIPIAHKLAGVRRLVAEIAEEYDPTDLTGTFEKFDVYSKLVSALQARKEGILKALGNDLKFMEKYGAAKEDLEKAKKEFASIKAAFDQLEAPKKVEDIPSVKEAIEKADRNIAAKLAQEGIDAEALYNEAVEDFNTPERFSLALNKFIKLSGYKDSSLYIRKINNRPVFKDITEIGGKLYYMIEPKPVVLNVAAPIETAKKGKKGCGCGKKGKKGKNDTPALNVSNPAASAKPANKKGKGCGKKKGVSLPILEPPYTGTMYSIYPIVDKNYNEEEPVVEKISMPLKTYNGKLFYVSEDKEIRVYNFQTKTNDLVDKGKLGSYLPIDEDDDSKAILGPDGDALYLKKKLEISLLKKKGCALKNLFKKEENKVSKNNCSLIKVNMETGAAEVIVPEIIDIMVSTKEHIFFTQSREVDKVIKGKRNKEVTIKVPKAFFCSYNMKTGVIEDLLDEHCRIIGSVGSKVVYTRFSPNLYNSELCVYNIDTKESTLLEDNIYDAFVVHKAKNIVLYSVGSAFRGSMFSIKLDGTERTEIIKNVVNKPDAFDDNWIYLQKGSGINKTLFKISYDGKDKILVASSIYRYISMTAGYVYYIDYFGQFCVVRSDGQAERVIADDCEDAKIIVDVDQVFLMIRERMGYNPDVFGTSLYTMDLNGNNLKKVFYGLVDMEEVDERRIFLLKEEVRKYKISTPQQKGDPIIKYITPTIQTYYIYDKFTREMKPVLVLGEPKVESVELKRGCFGKKKMGESTIELVPDEGFTRRGKLTLGQAAAEAVAKEQAEKEKKQQGGVLSSVTSAIKKPGGDAIKSGSGKKGTTTGKKKKAKWFLPLIFGMIIGMPLYAYGLVEAITGSVSIGIIVLILGIGIAIAGGVITMKRFRKVIPRAKEMELLQQAKQLGGKAGAEYYKKARKQLFDEYYGRK